MNTAFPRTPRASTRTDQRDATRRELVQAGLRLISDRGFAGATTAAIAQASGRAHGTVFVHFPTRDALVAEIVEEIGRSMSNRLAEADTLTPSVGEVLDAHLAALAEKESLYACLIREATSLPPAARARLFALQTGIAWRLRMALAHEVANQTARAIDPVVLANIWIALSNHYLINRDLFAPGASVIATRGAELKAQLLSIIKP